MMVTDGSSSASGFNVVLISIDTLRADHLGCYGYTRNTSPNIDRLANEGVRLNRYFANAGWTMPQHFTLFTGLYPQTHDMIRIQYNRSLSPRIRTLPELLQRHGYQTQAFSSKNDFLDPRHGYSRGFDHYQWGPGRHRHSREQTTQIIQWLRDHDTKRPFFLFIHNNDCHEPFDPPSEFDVFGDGYMDRYDGEILHMDHYVGKWIDAIRELNLDNRTLVLFTSDHGTEFECDHGFNGKSVSLYNPVLRCAFVAWAPGLLPQRRVVENLTETAQVPTTIFELLGLPNIPGAHRKGFARSLFSDTEDELSHVCSYTLRNGNVQLAAYNHFAIQTRFEKFLRLRLTAPFNPVFFHRNWVVRLKGLVKRLALDRRLLRWGGIVREFYDLRWDAVETRTLFSEGDVRANSMEVALNEWDTRSRLQRKLMLQCNRPKGRQTFDDSFLDMSNWNPVHGDWFTGSGGLMNRCVDERPRAVAFTKQFELPVRADVLASTDRGAGGIFFAVFSGHSRFRYMGLRPDRRSWVAGVYDQGWIDRLEYPDDDIDLGKPLSLSLVMDDFPPSDQAEQSGRRYRLYAGSNLVLTDEFAIEGVRMGLVIDGNGWTISRFQLIRLKAERQRMGALRRVEDV